MPKRPPRRPPAAPTDLGRGPATDPPPRDAEGDWSLLTDVRGLLGAPEPWSLVGFASTVLALLDEPLEDPHVRVASPVLSGGDRLDLIAALLDADGEASTGLLAVLRELVADEVTTRRIERELAVRDRDLPVWLEGLAPIDVPGARGLTDVLGDRINVAVGVRTAAGDECSIVVHVDRNREPAGVVRDAFVLHEPLEAVGTRFAHANHADPDLAPFELSPADARARVEQALEGGPRVHPAGETATWPACRPMLEWVLRAAPRGGVGDRSWSHDELHRIGQRLVRSMPGLDGVTDPLAVVEPLLRFGARHGAHDPLVWSPIRVERVLARWLPDDVADPPSGIAAAPAVLRGLVRLGHRERGIRVGLTTEVLDAIEQHEPTFHARLGRRRRTVDATEVLARTVGAAEEARWEAALHAGGERSDHRELMLELLAQTVGGERALRALDTSPLPEEAPAPGRVPAHAGDGVTAVAELVDGCCLRLFDAEHRTACARLLADVAGLDARLLSRGPPQGAAAAIVWIVARANDSVTDRRTGLRAGDLRRHFGLASSPSRRAATILRTLGVDEDRRRQGLLRLGTPRYLVSARRRAIAEHRDRLLAGGS